MVIWSNVCCWSISNIVTVTIATISLGVGIDYCIHVTEKYREGREKGDSHHAALIGVGGACGLALVGSAASDIAGFLVISLSPMGLFSNFGIYSAAMIGAKLVMPGPGLDGSNMCKMIVQEKVSLMAGVPTVWLGVYNYAKANNIKLKSVKKALVGGSALPESLLRSYEQDLGIPMQQGWGMTETSPIGCTYTPHPDTDLDDYDSTVSDKLLAGRRMFGIDMRIVDDENNILPEDGISEGHLQVKGPWVASGYFKGDGSESFTNDGWFATGDVSKLHPTGFMEITDRSKDVIKSGGEWVSSIDVENAASDHPEVAMAACIGIRHEKWQERHG